MVWRIEFERHAARDLATLDRQIARRILVFLHGRLLALEDPRAIGEALKGSKFGAFWKYRVGAYRIIADIQDNTLRILVVRVGNRKDIYQP